MSMVGFEVLDMLSRKAHDGRILLHDKKRPRSSSGWNSFEERPKLQISTHMAEVIVDGLDGGQFWKLLAGYLSRCLTCNMEDLGESSLTNVFEP